MERWTALARLTDAPGGPPRGRACLRKFGRRQPAHTGAGAPSGAPSRRSSRAFRVDPKKSESRKPRHRQSGRAFRGSRGAPQAGFPVSAHSRASVLTDGGPAIHVSQLLAGNRSVPGRSPDAARVRGCEPRARAPHQPSRVIPASATEGVSRRISGASRFVPPSRRLMMAPLGGRGGGI